MSFLIRSYGIRSYDIRSYEIRSYVIRSDGLSLMRLGLTRLGLTRLGRMSLGLMKQLQTHSNLLVTRLLTLPHLLSNWNLLNYNTKNRFNTLSWFRAEYKDTFTAVRVNKDNTEEGVYIFFKCFCLVTYNFV